MQKEQKFPQTIKPHSVDAHLITVDARDDELLINSVELASGQEQEARRLNGPKVQYVKVDVPGDGSCQISSFRLGMVAAVALAELKTTYQQGQLTPNTVAKLVMEKYLEAVRETYAQSAQPAQLSSTLALLPQLNGTMYDRDNLEMRHKIVTCWRREFAEWKNDLRRDVQNIIWQMLEAKGLVGSSSMQEFHTLSALDLSGEEEYEWDSEDLDDFEEENEEGAETLHYGPVPDEDFIFNALYYPTFWNSFANKSKQSDDQLGKMPVITAFGVDPADLLTMYVPMGVVQDGAFAQALRAFVASYAAQACVDEGFIPLGSLVVPELKMIGKELLEAYMDEFEVNCHLWGTESSLKALSDEMLAKVIIHTFNQAGRVARQVMFDDANALVPFQNGPVHLYQTGIQNHFQVLIGPFEKGFLSEDTSAEASPLSPGHWEDKFSESMESEDAEIPVLVIPQGYNAPSTENEEEARLHKSFWFLHCLASEFYDDFTEAIYPHMLERLFRALAVADSLPGKLDAQIAVELIQLYEQRQREREEQARVEKRKTRPPLVPMAGYVGELLQAYHMPLQEIFCLLPFVRDYVAFHQQKSSWKRAEAEVRVRALKNIALLLNTWADIYHQPALRRGPSIAEFLPRPSSLVPGTWEGLRMRSLLTIDPGELVGSEPEPYEAWDTFNEQLPGYVRAHLLNKHLGGPGTPNNLAFLSSSDNTRMSDLAEEDVKCLVLEENRIVFYTVAMPVGLDEIHQGAHIDKALTDAMVREVQMFASVVTPMMHKDEMPGFELDEDILRKKGQLQLRGVSLHLQGGVVLKATPPDMETIGRLQSHWSRRMKRTEASSKQERLETYGNQYVRVIERQAHRALLRTADTDERTAIIENALANLRQQGVDEKTIAEVLARLTTRKRETTMVEKASKRKAESELVKQPKRRKIAYDVLTRANIKVDNQQLEEIASLGKGTFAKYVELRKLGSDHKDAMRNCRRRRGGQFYKDAQEGAQNLKHQEGLHRFFKGAEHK